MLKETCSICFDCANAYAHRCRKIYDGTPIKGWTVRELKDGGYMVEECPNFKRDWDHRIRARDLSRILGICTDSVSRKAPGELIAIAREKGYQLKIQAGKTYRSYYIYRI